MFFNPNWLPLSLLSSCNHRHIILFSIMYTHFGNKFILVIKINFWCFGKQLCIISSRFQNLWQALVIEVQVMLACQLRGHRMYRTQYIIVIPEPPLICEMWSEFWSFARMLKKGVTFCAEFMLKICSLAQAVELSSGIRSPLIDSRIKSTTLILGLSTAVNCQSSNLIIGGVCWWRS